MENKARFVLSKSRLIQQYNKAKQMADSVSYSAKTNFEIAGVLEKETDSMFSVHFIRSLEKINDKKRVWYIAQGWDSKEVKTVIEQGVSCFIVDNDTDLKVLLAYIGQNEIKINLLLRMRLKEHTIHTGKHFVFGMYSEQINKWIPVLRKYIHIDQLGVHFHRKTQNVSEWGLKDELKDSLEKETLNEIDVVSIGGGIPIEYKNFSDICVEDIFNKIKELREWLKENNTKMIIEPGRFIAAPAVELETNIVNIYNDVIIVDASVYNSANDTFVSHIRLKIKGELEDHKGTAYKVKGCTPCSMDIFRYRVFLDNPKMGDKIVFVNAGAYNFSTDFCNLEKIETVVVD